MERYPEGRHLPDITEHEAVLDEDVSYEEPPLPFPDRTLGDGSESGELLAAKWPIGESIIRLKKLLEKYPVLSQYSDLPRAIKLLEEADEIVENLPTQPYPKPRGKLTNDEAIELAEELRERLGILED